MSESRLNTHYIHIPIEEAKQPKGGCIVYENKYWSELVDGHISIYVGTSKKKYSGYSTYSPQCNSDERIMKRRGKYFHLDFAFIPDLLNGYY
jgi:hypothetical protein